MDKDEHIGLRPRGGGANRHILVQQQNPSPSTNNKNKKTILPSLYLLSKNLSCPAVANLHACWDFIFPTGLSIGIWYFLTATSSISLKSELASNTITPMWMAVLVSALPTLGFLSPSVRAARSDNPIWVLMLLGTIQAMYTLTLFLSFLLEGVALTYTIKALEPLVNLCVLRLIGRPAQVTSLSLLGLCFLPYGIFMSQMSSVGGLSPHGLGFALMNVALTSVRSVLLKVYTYDPSVSYFHISTCGLLVLAPFALHVGCNFSPWDWLTSPNLLFGVASFVGYNFASFFVLSRVDPIFHAACNVLKRSITVVTSLWMLPRETMSPRQLVGIMFTFFALVVYALGRLRSCDNIAHNKWRMSWCGLVCLALATAMEASVHTSSSSQLADVDGFKYTLQRPLQIWTPPYRYHIVHSVLTRFMVGQPDQTTLAQARLKLFKTFCHPTMTHQTSQNYHWVVLVDPGLDGLIIQEIKSLLTFTSPTLDNMYMVMTNNTMWMQDGTNQERETAAYGVSLSTIATEWSRSNLDVITGNRAHLTRTLEWYNNRKKRENLIVIETLLDADDGMHHEGIAGIQEFAVEHTHVILQQKQEQQDRQHMRTNPTVKTESSSPSSSPIRDWWILCGTDHIEWHNRDVYTLKRDEHKKVGITSGVVGIRLKPKECISAGYTRIGLVTENFKDTTKSRSRSSNVAHSDFPLAASRNHFIATREYPPCAMNVVTHCYHRFFVDKPLTVRTRSITSDGMTHLDPKMNGYNMKTATIPDTEFETSKGEEVWRLLQHEFFIDRYEAYQTSIFLFERRIDILAENEKGRCIPGFPCNKVATDIHKSLKMTITDGSDRLLDTRVQAKSRLVLMTAVFGVSPLPVYFPVFLRSIQASGADGIVIGGDEMELKDSLPPNVRHIPMTWNGLHNLISYKLFGGDPLPGFQAANGYKVNDVKPLYGFLFREYIQEYEFWAHVDNDMIFGDVARFMNPMMDKFDIISALGRGQADCGLKNPCKITHGPFTAYRNVPEITELFRLIEVNLYETLNTAQAYGVDEWGGLRKRLGTNNVGSNDYLRSMSHVIHKYRHILPIRVGSAVPFACAYYSEHACDCVWTTSDGASSHLNANGRDVVFCHFLKTKHTAAKRLLEMPKNDREAIFHATSVMWSKEHGISIVDNGKGGGGKLDPEKNLGTKNQGNATSPLPVDDHHAYPTSNNLASNALRVRDAMTTGDSLAPATARENVTSSVLALIVPNVLLVGVQKAGSTAVSEWLFSLNSTCKALTFDNEPVHFGKEVHFFDKQERFNHGKEFYARRFEHCSSSDLVIDATPDYATFATRIGDFYRQLRMISSPNGHISNLKVMMILREPVSRELSAYNHKKYNAVTGDDSWALKRNYSSFDEYVDEENLSKKGFYSTQLRRWFHALKRDQILILSYHELKGDPTTFQRRIVDFLGLPLNSMMPQMTSENDKSFPGKEAVLSCRTRNKLGVRFQPHNEDLYSLLIQNPGPPMEQRPFPEFEVAACKDKEHGISIVDDGKGGGVKLDSEKNLGTKNQGNATSSLPVDDHHANPTSNKLDTKNNDSNRGGESPLQITHKTGTKMLNDWELRQPTAIRLHDARSAFVKKRHQCVEAIRNRHKVISDLLKPFLPQIIKDGSQYHPKVILVDPAYHANVGDHMLTLGEFVFLRGLGVHPLEEVIQCGPDHQHKVALCHSLKWWTDPNAEKLPALSHAGGNWGDLWPRHQKLRNQMIKMYAERNMLLISMPQSLYYENKDFEREDSMTIEESLTSGEINNQNVSKSTNIYLLWREKFSLTEANRLYPHATNILMPDIAFQLGPYEAQPLSSSDPRSVDIVFFLRDDKESVHSTDRNPVRIREMLIALGGAEGEKSTFIIVDWIDRLKMFNSSNFLFTDTAIKMLSAGRVLICDRLHASILSYLSGIPFIFLDQLTGKLSKSLSVALTSAEGCSDGSLGMFARATNLTQAIELALEFLATGHFRPDPTTTTSWTVTN